MIKIKKMMTPRLTFQKPIFFRRRARRETSCRMNPKMTDMVINERGKEKPRKKVFRVSFSKDTSFRYALFHMTRPEMISPMLRHSREAW